MPATEADAKPDTGGSQSGGTISDADEEIDSDFDSRPCQAAKAKRIAYHLMQLGDNMGPESANKTAMYPSTLEYAYTIGHPPLDTPKPCEIPSTPRNRKEVMASA